MSYRMARILPINYLLLLITLLSVVRAAPFGLPSDFSSLIPACAAVCFQSFLSVSFGNNAPASLESLCSRVGASDFTLGEAAVQCLVAERAVGYCSDREASDTIINKAYYMCYGQPNAVQPTHSVITATLAIPQYGSGPITFPPMRTSTFPTAIPASQSRSVSLTLPTTLVTDPTSLSSSIRPSVGTTSPRPTSATSSQTQTSSPVSTTTSAPTTFATTTRTTTSATETSTKTDAPTAGAGSDGDKKKSTSSGTIAGVTVGVIAGVAFFAIGIAVFLRYTRRKKFRQWRMAGKNGGSPSRDTWGYNIEKGPNGGGGTDSWITNQLRAPLDPNPPPPPKSYSRASWRPSAIGLAISPSFSRDVSRTATPTRRMSRLLPAKPIMSGASKENGPAEDQEHLMTGAAMAGVAAAGIAIGASTATNQATQARNLTGRDKPHPPLPKLQIQIPPTRSSKVVAPAGPGLESTVTEFEEDGKTSVSPGGGLFWRPPSTDPMTAATYVADKTGNWVLLDPQRAAEMEALVTPMTAEPKSSIQPKLAVAAGVGAGAVGASYVISKKNEEKEEDEAKAVPRPLPNPSEPLKGAETPKEKAPSRPTSTIRIVEPSDSSSADEEMEQPFAPRPLFSASQKQRRSSKRMSARSLTHPRTMSTDSGVTTISDSSEEDSYHEGGLAAPPKPRVELSPVAEPLNFGKTPSAMPQPQESVNINPPEVNNTLMVPPPANPPGQPSPTLGLIIPPTATRQPLGASTMSSHNRQGQGKRTMGPRPLEAPGAMRTGSPAMKHVAFAPTEPDDRRQLPSSNLRLSADQSKPRPLPIPVPRESIQSNASYQYPQQHIAAHQRHHTMNQPMPYQLPPHPSAYRQHPPQHLGYHQQGYYPNRPPGVNQNYNVPPRPHQNRYPYHQPRDSRPPFNPPNLQEQSTFQSQLQEQPGVGGGPYPQLPRLHIPAPQQQQQQHQPPHQPYAHPYGNSSPSTNSSTPSLLAKRVGSDRAANMTLPTQQAQPSKNSKWYRQENEFISGEPIMQQQQQRQSQPGDLPATPVWLPKLTPTRRGEDMYLNVN